MPVLRRLYGPLHYRVVVDIAVLSSVYSAELVVIIFLESEDSAGSALKADYIAGKAAVGILSGIGLLEKHS